MPELTLEEREKAVAEKEKILADRAKALEAQEVRMVPSDQYLKTVAEASDTLKHCSEAINNWTKIAEDLAKGRRASRFVKTGEEPEPVLEFKDVLAFPKKEDLFEEVKDLNDRVASVMLYKRAEIQRRTRSGESASFNIAEMMKGLEAYKRLQYIREKAAGDFWYTGGTAAGAEWVPTGYATEVIPVYRLAKNVLPIFPMVQMPRRNGPFRVPVKTSKSAWAIVAEEDGVAFSYPHGAGTLVNAGTSYIELTAKKHKGISGLSREEEEDAIVLVMQQARTELGESGMEALESGLINGMATVGDVLLDGATGPANANGYQNGLRYYAIVTNANTVNAGGDALSLVDIEAGRAAQGKFGVRPGENVIITTPKGYVDVIQETNSPIRLANEFGAGATLLSGELARVYGTPVVVSDEIPNTQDLNGKNAGTGTFGCTILTNYQRWRFGMKRGMEIREIELVGDDAMVLVGFVRTAFGQAPPNTDDHTVVIRNHL
jgi:hypothetical protein